MLSQKYEMFKNKKILITGAGTIGSAILEKLLEFDIHTIRMFDNCELKLHNLKQIHKNNRKVKYLLGDIRDKDRLKIAIRGVDIVFHTAALKHVFFCEDNPIDTVKTNILGTQNIIDVCIEENVEKVIYISTDKAVSPINVMGATKLVGERLITCAANYKGRCKTIFSSVRFGNVINSSGSIIQIFNYQILNNLPLTITDINATRYMMEIEDAVNLILNAVSICKGQEIFILKMPIINILDLAKKINKENDRNENNYVVIGLPSYEKLHEELITNEEKRVALQNENMIIISPQGLISYYMSIGYNKL